MKNLKRHSFRYVFISVIFLIAFMLNGCRNADDAAQKTKAIFTMSKSREIAEVKKEKIGTIVAGYGLMQPVKTIGVSYRDLFGPIKKLMIRQYDYVTKGQALVEIIPDNINQKITEQETVVKQWPIKLLQIDQEINACENSLSLSKLNLDMVNKRVSANNITDSAITMNQALLQQSIQLSAYKNTMLQKQLALFDYKVDKEKLSELKKKVKQNILRAPVSGLITSVDNLSLNEIVNKGQIIANIAEPDDIVFFMLPSENIPIEGITSTKLLVDNEAYDVKLYAARPGDNFNIQTSNLNSKNAIKVCFVNKIPKFSMDKLISVKLQVNLENALTIPTSSIYESGGKTFVNVLNGKYMETKSIITGIEIEDKFVVLNGLRQGEKVIIQ